MYSAHKKRDLRVARLFKLVSSPTRVSILMALSAKKTLVVTDIAKAVGMTHSAVSHQLGLLSRAGIVASVRQGRTVRYSLGKKLEARALIKFLRTL